MTLPFRTEPDYWNKTKDVAAKAFGFGTSSSRFQMGETSGNLVGLFAETEHASGDARTINARLYFSAAGSSGHGGECVRAYSIVNGVTVAQGGTVNGAHVSLSLTGAGAKISGAGHASRHTLELGDDVDSGGTIDVAQFDTSIHAGATIPVTAAFLSVGNLSDGKLPYFLRIFAPDTTDMFVDAGTGASSAGASGGAAAAKVLKVRVDSTDYWLPLYDSNADAG